MLKCCSSLKKKLQDNTYIYSLHVSQYLTSRRLQLSSLEIVELIFLSINSAKAKRLAWTHKEIISHISRCISISQDKSLPYIFIILELVLAYTVGERRNKTQIVSNIWHSYFLIMHIFLLSIHLYLYLSPSCFFFVHHNIWFLFSSCG